MAELVERNLVWEVLVLRDGRWNVVEIHDSREDALADAERRRSGQSGVKVTIERYDPESRTYMSTTVWEWIAPVKSRSAGTTKAWPDVTIARPAAREPARRSWWRRLFGRR
ncbi:hypothetical protein [Zavarzinia sp.]|uniref:hypothetical protein n=1 Tax=Zavarzinia sp. TaxID=2027920 RepID=UPI003567AF23